MFNDPFSVPPQDKYGYPGINYPTANPRDKLIIEEYPAQTGPFHALGYGTPHDTETICLLCFQGPSKGTGVDKGIRRYYANPRLAQEPYNLTNGGNALNNPDYPVFVRSYLLPRNYTKGTVGQALGALIALVITSGGTGYNSGLSGQIALTITGNAVGFAEVVAGVIVSAFLTNSGSGYNSTQTVTASGGTGAVISGLVQDQTAILTEETETPAEEPYGGYFVRVERKWERIPGPELIKPGYESETGARMRTVRQEVLLPTLPVALAASRSFNSITMYCADSYVEPGDSNKGTLVTVYMEKPATYTQKSSEKSVCPAVFSYIGGWVISGDGFSNHGPFAGVNFTLTAKRTAVAVSEQISYTLGASGVALPTLWNVISPGAASRFFPISGDTIHNAIFVQESITAGPTQTEEDLPASTPSSYTPGQDMIIHASEKPWKYQIFNEKRIATATEPT